MIPKAPKQTDRQRLVAAVKSMWHQLTHKPGERGWSMEYLRDEAVWAQNVCMDEEYELLLNIKKFKMWLEVEHAQSRKNVADSEDSRDGFYHNHNKAREFVLRDVIGKLDAIFEFDSGESVASKIVNGFNEFAEDIASGKHDAIIAPQVES